MSFVTTGKSPLDSMERDENGVVFFTETRLAGHP